MDRKNLQHAMALVMAATMAMAPVALRAETAASDVPANDASLDGATTSDANKTFENSDSMDAGGAGSTSGAVGESGYTENSDELSPTPGSKPAAVGEEPDSAGGKSKPQQLRKKNLKRKPAPQSDEGGAGVSGSGRATGSSDASISGESIGGSLDGDASSR